MNDPDDPPNCAMIASHTEGYAPIDLQTLMKRALHGAASRAFEMHGAKASQVSNMFGVKQTLELTRFMIAL